VDFLKEADSWAYDTPKSPHYSPAG